MKDFLAPTPSVRQPLFEASDSTAPSLPASRFTVCTSRFTLGQKSCRPKVSQIFGIFVPDFAPNVAPNFPRIFRGLFVLRFVGDGEQKKIHQKSPPFFNAKFPGKHEKIIHKVLLESRQSNTFFGLENVAPAGGALHKRGPA